MMSVYRLVAISLFSAILYCFAVNAEANTQDASPQASNKAKMFLRLGEEAMINGLYDTAVDQFTKYIEVEPSTASYNKRATIYFRRKDWIKAYDDFMSAVSHSKSFDALTQKSMFMGAQAAIHIGKCTEAKENLVKIRAESGVTDASALEHLNRAEKCILAEKNLNQFLTQYNVNNVAQIDKLQPHLRPHLLSLLSTASEYVDGKSEYLIYRAKILLLNNQPAEVISLTRIPFNQDKSNLNVVTLRAQAYYLIGEHAATINYCKQGLHVDPEYRPLQQLFKKAKQITRLLDNASDAEVKRKYDQMLDSLTKALKVDNTPRAFITTTHKKLCQGALAAARQGSEQATKYGQRALEYCEEALKGEHSADNLVARADTHMILEQYQQALNDYQAALQMNQQHQQANEGVRKAQLELKKSERKDYYKILGVKKTANAKEVKKAYRKLAKQFHPDMVSVDEKEEAQKRFQDIGEAYEILSDPEKKGKYDRGEDVTGQNQGHPGHHGFPFPQGFHFGGGGGGNFHYRFG